MCVHVRRCVCVCERESYMNWGGLGCCLLSFLKSRGGLLALLPEIIHKTNDVVCKNISHPPR